jgi:hypothetical protein
MAESITGTLGITYVDRPDDVYTAKTYAATATNAVDAAKTAQTAAATSETNAKTSETNAASSASAANTSDTNAAASATTATSKASDAASSATAAKTSETNAKLSEESASSSASQASSYASGASTSASNAKDWAESTSSPDGNTDTASSTGSTQSAKSWALDAESSATTATSKASAAATSETNAATSKTAAATSETNAAASATAAKESETNAASSAEASAASQTAAKTSETNAASSEANAKAYATSAGGSATAAANSAKTLTYATSDEAAAGTATDRMINPATLKNVLDTNLSPIKTDISDLQTATSVDSIRDMILNQIIPQSAAAHNALYRGKDLTIYFDSGKMSKAIAASTFVDIYPGDYITKSVTVDGTTYSNVKWIVADLDYHLHRGDTETTAHHVVMIPERNIGMSKMNDSNTTAGGYQGSYMWGTTIPKYVTGITAAFGSDHVLTHRERLTKQMDANSYAGGGGMGNGATVYTDGEWVNVSVNIPNEAMMYGHAPFASSGRDTYDCNKQLTAFRYGQNFTRTSWCWLRDVASAIGVANVNDCGEADCGGASYVGGVRPYFLLR